MWPFDLFSLALCYTHGVQKRCRRDKMTVGPWIQVISSYFSSSIITSLKSAKALTNLRVSCVPHFTVHTRWICFSSLSLSKTVKPIEHDELYASRCSTECSPASSISQMVCWHKCYYFIKPVFFIISRVRYITSLSFSSHKFGAFIRSTTYCQTEAVAAVEKLTTPVPEGMEKPVSPKIDKLASDISSLNLLEVAELSDVLKRRLNLPDAPMMPMGGFAMAKAEVETL